MSEEEARPRGRGLGEALDGWSIGELEAWIAALEAEIGRARAAIEAKSASRAAAEAAFKGPRA